MIIAWLVQSGKHMRHVLMWSFWLTQRKKTIRLITAELSGCSTEKMQTGIGDDDFYVHVNTTLRLVICGVGVWKGEGLVA